MFIFLIPYCPWAPIACVKNCHSCFIIADTVNIQVASNVSVRTISVTQHTTAAEAYVGEEASKYKRQLKSTCQGRHLSSKRVESQTRRGLLHQGPGRKPRAVDQHVKFSAAAGVAAHAVMLVEIYLARVHHFPAWVEKNSREYQRQYLCYTAAEGCVSMDWIC